MYEECLKCSKLGNPCDGPNFIAMKSADLIAWCNARRKQIPGLTYDRIAEKTGLSKGTVSGFFGGTHADYRLETVRPILEQLLGGRWEDSPCADPAESERAAYEARIRKLEQELELHKEKLSHYMERVEHHKENAAYLKEQIRGKNRSLAVLGTLLCMALVGIVWVIVASNL